MAASRAASGAASGDAPGRVVSINLCTDQLAMLVAGPGQLASVSYLARDPMSSAMARAAQGYPVNRGRAEDVYLLRPDLVLAGRWTTPATVAMLERLEVPVIRFDLVEGIGDVAGQLRQMGQALGQQTRAEDLARAFEADLAALGEWSGERRRAALYAPNSYTSGMQSFPSQIMALAGLANIADEVGLPQGGFLALEQLVLAQPELLVRSQLFEATSRAEAVTRHPALRGIADGAVTSADWVCGTPHVLGAITRLRDLP